MLLHRAVRYDPRRLLPLPLGTMCACPLTPIWARRACQFEFDLQVALAIQALSTLLPLHLQQRGLLAPLAFGLQGLGHFQGKR